MNSVNITKKLYHQEFIQDIEEYTKHYTIISGQCDCIKNNGSNQYYYKITNNESWVILGELTNEFINKIIMDSSFFYSDGISGEGYYAYKAVIYYTPDTWDEKGESYIDYIDFNFIETFTSRDRDNKLNKLLL